MSEAQRYRLGQWQTTVEFRAVTESLADTLASTAAPTEASPAPVTPTETPPVSAGASPTATLSTPPSGMVASSRVPLEQRQRVFVIDAAVKRAHALPDVSLQYVMEASEAAKSMRSAELLLDWLLEQRVQRGALLTAIGGGVVSDLAGFVAAIYQRGIALHLYPTTLLAMVDASFGGKTGVNYGGYKNMVGSFYPAERVIIAPQVLVSLPEREIRNGLAEAIKSALLGDEELFGILRLRRDALMQGCDLALLSEVAQRALAVKARIVTADFTDRGERALLNLGHTFAHALESSGDFARWSHGEAVAWGMAQALRLGIALQMTDRAYAETVWQLLHEYGYQLEIDGLDWSVLLPRMRRDKKAAGTEVHFIVPCALGINKIVPLEIDRVSQLLRTAPPLGSV